ncbi:MAG TPA: hypothetical protein VFP10_12400 [Candidatus Eisenbacteria bacterium]|nr:hypothetical protein [Candidatus Eisenbacteria bacterium]
MLWILDHQRDIAADLRVLCRVSWREALEWSGPEFLALAYRLPAYGGVMTARAYENERPAGRVPADARRVPGTREAIMANADLAAVVSFGKG